jgi:hypothetical protein
VPKFNLLNPIESCNEGLTKATFNPTNWRSISFYNNTLVLYKFPESLQMQKSKSNEQIIGQQNTTPKEILSVEDENCYAIILVFFTFYQLQNRFIIMFLPIRIVLMTALHCWFGIFLNFKLKFTIVGKLI